MSIKLNDQELNEIISWCENVEGSDSRWVPEESKLYLRLKELVKTWCPEANDYIPFGICPRVSECKDPDITCYGSMCDECENTCKSKFSIGACIKYRRKP